MNQPERFQNKKPAEVKIWIAAAVLFLCVMLTASVVCAGMGLFTSVEEPDAVISLLPPAKKPSSAAPARGSVLLAASPAGVRLSAAKLANTSPNFFVSDDQQVWGSQTQVDIFHACYENGAGVITAAGKNGDKIVAPGASNSYLFHLTNDSNAAIDYEMHITATLSSDLNGYTFPVQVRLSDDSGTWLCGSADTWESFTALNGTSRKAVLGADSYSAYTLEWQWPYDSGNDEVDTLLGNLSDEEDLVLTVQIGITAQYDPDPGTHGGRPNTGDSFRPELWIGLMLLSLAGLIVTLAFGWRAKRRSEV